MSGYPLLSNRTGNYAVTTDRNGLWNRAGSQASAPTAAKGRRTKAPPAVVNPIFAEYATRVSDVYWQSIFQNASIGKFPRGFSFQDNVLIYKQRSKLHRLAMGDILYHEFAHLEVIEFFGRAGLRSSSDQERIRQQQEDRNAEDAIESMRWSSIRRNRVKDILISGFVDDLSKSMGLTPRQCIQLKTIIGLGFILGYFDGDNVIMANGKIQSIEGIVYDAGKKAFDIDPKITPKKSKSKSKKAEADPETTMTINGRKEINFMAIWIKYLEALDRKRIDPTSQGDLPDVKITLRRNTDVTGTDTDNDTDTDRSLYSRRRDVDYTNFQIDASSVRIDQPYSSVDDQFDTLNYGDY